MPSDEAGFSPETFARRRGKVMAALEGSVMVLPSAPIRYASRDTEYPYRPDHELYYLTGVVDPGAVAVLRGDSAEQGFHLFIRPRDEEAELWSGPRLGPEEAGEEFGADAAHSMTEIEDRLGELLRGARHIYYRLGRDPDFDALVQRGLAHGRARGAREGVGPLGVIDPGVILDELRLRKDDTEIVRLRRAADITVRAHREAMAHTRPGLGEWELQAIVESSFRRQGAEGPAFGTIVGGGAHACVLHYVENRSRLEAGQMVLVDAGASVDLYNGDLTRSYPVSGTFTSVQSSIYEVVNAARMAAVDTIRPGALVAEVHAAAVRVILDGLRSAGVLSGSLDELVELEAHKPYFPHQTSHWIGLDVHDVGDYKREGASRALEPGMALTVEPGLYFRPDGGEDARAFEGFGVRVEDSVLVTDAGCEILTAGAPVDPSEIEALVGTADASDEA